MNVQNSIIHNSERVETIQADEKINKIWYIHTMEYYIIGQ